MVPITANQLGTLSIPAARELRNALQKIGDFNGAEQVHAICEHARKWIAFPEPQWRALTATDLFSIWQTMILTEHVDKRAAKINANLAHKWGAPLQTVFKAGSDLAKNDAVVIAKREPFQATALQIDTLIDVVRNTKRSELHGVIRSHIASWQQ